METTAPQTPDPATLLITRRKVVMRENTVSSQAIKEKRMDQTLDDVTARWNLLEHSFYQRWTRGELTRDELCDYVGQYAHVVRAVPGWLEQVRGGDTADLARHAAEEQSHLALWLKFGEALGLSSDAISNAPANAATSRLIQRGDELVAGGEAAPVVWALETQTPAVAGAKLAGLSAFYGIGAEGGGEYFAVHQHLDVEHAAELRELCPAGSQNAAAAMSEALWDLLTSVERAPGA
jgi:pyrroloquinoline-quinone synthase